MYHVTNGFEAIMVLAYEDLWAQYVNGALKKRNGSKMEWFW
jgi:hypothetical protein